ncbi:MAG TPA: response regulator [Syntrophomonadaceae bacterium]|nr:response regulator [Syntrophomonadaceae bacterium]
MHVLVVEDNSSNMELIVEVLELAGFHVVQAFTVEEAMQKLIEGGIDVVIVDISLKGVDGLFLTKQIKSKPEWRSLPVVVVTAHTTDVSRQHAWQAGCDRYITKPIDIHTFAGEILALCKANPLKKQQSCCDNNE